MFDIIMRLFWGWYCCFFLLRIFKEVKSIEFDFKSCQQTEMFPGTFGSWLLQSCSFLSLFQTARGWSALRWYAGCVSRPTCCWTRRRASSAAASGNCCCCCRRCRAPPGTWWSSSSSHSSQEKPAWTACCRRCCSESQPQVPDAFAHLEEIPGQFRYLGLQCTAKDMNLNERVKDR